LQKNLSGRISHESAKFDENLCFNRQFPHLFFDAANAGLPKGLSNLQSYRPDQMSERRYAPPVSLSIPGRHTDHEWDSSRPFPMMVWKPVAL
jgi:hypothetical protein